jgi:hypothetical protein
MHPNIRIVLDIILMLVLSAFFYRVYSTPLKLRCAAGNFLLGPVD